MPAPTRLTVHPGEDVLLPAGTPLAALRARLADLLRRPELRHVALWADGVAVAPGSVVGERPLLPGAVLRTDGGGCRPGPWSDDAALRSPWLVARTTGAEAGALAALDPATPLRLPGGATVTASPRGRVRVRARRGAHLRAADGRPRRVGPLGRRWHLGHILEVGCQYTLHRSGDAGTVLAGVLDSPGAPTADAPGTGVAAALATALLPAAGSIGLAATLHQPMYALFAVVGVLAAVPQVAGVVRRRRAAPPAAPGGAGAPGLPDDPAGLARLALAALSSSDAAWRDAVSGRVGALGSARAGGPDDRGRTTADERRSGTHPAAGTLLARGTLLADGALAVRGSRPAATAAARAVVAGLVARGATVRVTGAGRAGWAWCRWAAADDADTLVADHPSGAELDAAHAQHRAGTTVVLVLPPEAQVPSWCRAALDVVTDPGPPRVRHARPDGGAALEPLVGVDALWAERLVRRLTGARALGRDVRALWAPADDAGVRREDLPAGADPADPRLPGVVPLAGLLRGGAAGTPGVTTGPRGAVSPMHATDASHRPWAVPLGVDGGGRTVTFDLVDDGPHLLVAGTTGAGKSELLQAFVLALALRRTPDDLALALIDFKGGASFGACVRLPHVVGQVTDLDAGLAARALDGLRAELRRRKEILAAHGVADVVALPAGVLPRLVVVVDEFRALADDLPELLPGLLRVAAQGRSLGVHLVLATQRPAGAVSADVRANVSARLALRVVDAADSHDVLDSPAAARIPAGVPGRAVLRVGAQTPVALQCAYAGAAPASAEAVTRAPAWSDLDGERPATGPDAAVRGAPGGRDDLVPNTVADHHLVPVSRAPGDDATDRVAALVDCARAAAGVPGPRWPAPWLPPLPATAQVAEVAALLAATPAAPGDVPIRRAGLPLALGDSPTTQSRVAVAWDPTSGHLAILGRARSGRTTALRALAHTALERGWHVHALVPSSAATAFEELTRHPGFGTLAGPGDPRRTARLLRLLSRPPRGGTPVLVLVDGVEELRSALASPVDDPLAAALAAGTSTFAVTAESAGLGGLAARFGPRLVLVSADAAGDAMLGAPSPLAGRGRTPGRGAWLAGDDPLECQVALPAPGPAVTRAVPEAPVRVLPLPRAVGHTALLRTDPGAIGLAGDDAAPVGLDVTLGALVVGPRGSGRTTALRVLLAARPAPSVVIARDRDLTADAARRGARVVPPTPAGLRALLDDLTGAAAKGAAGPPPVVLIDDADALVQSAPVETDRLTDLAVDGVVTVVAAATTLAAGIAHRGLLAHLRAGRTGVVLCPAERGSQDVFGGALDDAVEPGLRVPGRGALVVDGTVSAVQLAAPPAPAASGAPPPDATTPDAPTPDAPAPAAPQGLSAAWSP